MLLNKKSLYNKYNLQDAIDCAESIAELNAALDRAIKQGTVEKYIPDFFGRLRYIINELPSNLDKTKFLEGIDQTWNIIWKENYSFFDKHFDDLIILCREIGSILTMPENYAKIIFGRLNPILIFMTPPRKENIDMVLQKSNSDKDDIIKRDFLNPYIFAITSICQMNGYECDTLIVQLALEKMPLNLLYEFSLSPSDYKSHPDSQFEILTKYVETLHSQNFFQKFGEYSEDSIKGSEEAFFKSMIYLYDIWNNRFSLGREILQRMYRELEIDREDAELFDFIHRICDKYNSQREYLEDIGILYKDFYIELNRHVKLVPDREGNDIIVGRLFNRLRDICSAYICTQNGKLDLKIFNEVSTTLFGYAIDNIPKFSEYKPLLYQKFRNMLADLNEQPPCKDRYPEEILLGFIDDDDYPREEAVDPTPATEAKSVIKDDGSAKVTDANMVKDNRPRSKTGQYQSKTADVKSAGLTVAHAFNIFKQNKDQIERQLDKGFNALRDVIFGTKKIRTAIVEGKKFSITSLFKKMIGMTCLFSFGKINAILFLIVRGVNRGKIKKQERRRIIADIEEELELIEEKINDASADGDRKAKYALMRSRSQLKNALSRIRYGYEAKDDTKAVDQLRQKEGL